MNKYEQIAEAIKATIKSKGINQSQFAALMEVQDSTVTKWLKGHHNFCVETLFKIEAVLGIDLFKLETVNRTQTIKYRIKVDQQGQILA